MYIVYFSIAKRSEPNNITKKTICLFVNREYNIYIYLGYT